MNDRKSVELPALSPRSLKNNESPQPVPMKKYLEVKDGFDFTNNISDRIQEKLSDLKHT